LPENRPHIKADPTLLAVLILSILVDLQLGHFISVCIGLPQFGQFSAESDISLWQSGQVISGMINGFSYKKWLGKNHF
jgi:hypothetical protein